MPNPYAPKGPVRHANETQNPVDEFADRLVTLGADRATVDDWLDEISLDSAEFDRVRHLSDDELRFHLEAVTGVPDEEPATVDDGPILGQPVDLPGGLLDRNVPEILAWVNASPAERAPVVLELERLADRPRKTLTGPLEEHVDGATE